MRRYHGFLLANGQAIQHTSCEFVVRLDQTMRIFSIAIVLTVSFTFQIPAPGQQLISGWIGVQVETVTPALKTERKTAVSSGVIVAQIASKSPAASILRIGDVIAFLN